jgi:hypothetical protein
MKTNFKYYFLTGALCGAFMLLTNCSGEPDLLINDLQESSETYVNNYFVKADIAKSIAVSFDDNLNPNILQTRNLAPYKTVRDSHTKMTKEGDPAFYVFNYTDGGAMIVSADSRTYPILASIEEGEFPSDMSELPLGPQIWMENMIDEISAIREQNLEQSDDIRRLWDKVSMPTVSPSVSTRTLPTEEPGDPDCHYLGETVEDAFQYGPFFSSSWRQDAPYNNNAPLCTSTTRKLLGCTTIAAALVMRYHQYPSTFNWSAISFTGSNATTEAFLYNVAQTIGVSWGCGGTSASLQDLKNALQDYGYGGIISNIYGTEVLYDIRNNRPVIFSGVNSSGVGHAWVATGVRYIENCHCVYNESNNLVKAISSAGVTSFYMDWGHGNTNGWYYISSLPSGKNYSSNQKMIYSIYPN